MEPRCHPRAGQHHHRTNLVQIRPPDLGMSKFHPLPSEAPAAPGGKSDHVLGHPAVIGEIRTRRGLPGEVRIVLVGLSFERGELPFPFKFGRQGVKCAIHELSVRHAQQAPASGKPLPIDRGRYPHTFHAT